MQNTSDAAISKYVQSINNGWGSSTNTVLLEKQLVEIYEYANLWIPFPSDITVELSYNTEHYSIVFENKNLVTFLHKTVFSVPIYSFSFDDKYLTFEHEGKNIRISSRKTSEEVKNG
jgi:hypothetical protein